ncbi:hypothetical protein ACIQXI_10620 [Lysinibacillus sp. NPDC097195]|uniref:hypothetical protein n=1 Tax=Lysinibacillus sp. NPDC097195 TaxID=3364141 RepID=UPI0037FD948F
MDEIKNFVLRLIEIIVFLSIGLLFTLNILKPIYEHFGISFYGNTWVNWFGVAYIFFVFYNLIFGLFIFKANNLFTQRMTSVIFWLIFIASIYVVFIPFIKGENPF